MMFKELKYLLIPVLILFSSCQEKLDDYLILRSWIIKEMVYKGEDLKPNLTMNVLGFETNNKCDIPIYNDGSSIYKSDSNGKWSITADNKLKIESVKEYMNGEFDICFGKDEVVKSVYMIVKSEDLYLKAYRGNFREGFKDALPISCGDNQTDDNGTD